MAIGKHLCSICGSWHSPHMPDNTTMVPICKECWGKTEINSRLVAISLARATNVIENLDRTIFEGIDGAIIKLVDARMKELNRHSEN